VLLGVALLADAPRIVTASVLSIILVAVGGGVLNHFDKVSVHVMVTVSCATLLMTVLWPAGLLMGWGAVLVSWARIQLQCHTLRQVVEGWLIALLSAGGVWMVYLR
jgi:membrane-associated phospholipid phosphatase